MAGARVTKLLDEDLTRLTYGFSLMGSDLILDSYSRETRLTKRHKFTIDYYYDRTNPRSSNLTEDQVELPEDIRKEALDYYISKLAVYKWSESKWSQR